MKILLLNPPFGKRFNRSGRWASATRSNVVCYPIWLSYATGWLEKEGHCCKLVDAPARGYSYSDVKKIVEDFEPDYLVVDTATTSIMSDSVVALSLKAKFNLKTVIVGSHASAMPKETLEMSNADHVIVGEYDLALENIVKGQERHKIIQGIPFRDLDSLPFVSKVYRDHLNIDDYEYSLARKPEVQVTFSRGCAHFCNYCVWSHTLTGRQVRWMSAKRVLDELEWIQNNLNIRDIVLEDDTFTDNQKRTLEICQGIQERRLNIEWITNARPNVPFSLLKTMKSAGCRKLIVGYESGNQGILILAKKGTTLAQMLQFSKDVKEAHLETMGCFMIGLLGETKATAKETFEFAKEVDPDFYFFTPATPYAGTAFYEECKKSGWLISDDFTQWTDEEGCIKGVVDYPDLSAEEIKRLADSFTLKFAFRPHFVLKSLGKMLRHPLAEGPRYTRTFKYGLHYLWRKKTESFNGH